MRSGNLFGFSLAAALFLGGAASAQDQDPTSPESVQGEPAAADEAIDDQAAPLEGQEGITPEMQLDVAEEHTTVELEPGDPHRIYVVDPVFPHLIASKVWIYDGEDGRLLGMLNSGYVPNLVLAPDHSELYVAETYWSRGSRGDRTDVVTTYDARTLLPTGEVRLPEGRFLVVTKRHDADISPDGRYFYSFNMAPLTTISVVDLQEDTYKGEIEIPGCALVFPTGDRAFASLCSDGSLLTVTFDEAMQADIARSEPFFDAENDPVFEHVGFDRDDKVLHMVSYSGRYYSADLSGAEPQFSDAWDFLGEADRAENWRPGGWQLLSYHAATDRLFVLMHQGADWTHKHAGEAVWELDPAAKQVVRKIDLEEAAMSIAVSRDDNPVLVALSEAASIVTYDMLSGEARAHIEGLGDSPFVVMLEGN